jgi:hypothetical protein
VLLLGETTHSRPRQWPGILLLYRLEDQTMFSQSCRVILPTGTNRCLVDAVIKSRDLTNHKYRIQNHEYIIIIYVCFFLSLRHVGLTMLDSSKPCNGATQHFRQKDASHHQSLTCRSSFFEQSPLLSGLRKPKWLGLSQRGMKNQGLRWKFSVFRASMVYHFTI